MFFSAQLVERVIPILHNLRFESSRKFTQKFAFLHTAVSTFWSDVD